MNRFFTAILPAIVLATSVGCSGSGVSNSSSFNVSTSQPEVGPAIQATSAGKKKSDYSGIRLDVITPVFDPRIPENSNEYDKLGIWPELRRTEAVRFAAALKEELQSTNVFGDVRVTPDANATGDLYVMGAIEKSNGEDVHIQVKVVDISGKTWMDRAYKHRVKEYHWQDSRKKGIDPYKPVFEKVVKDVVKLMKKRSQNNLATLRNITEIRFAGVFVEDAFSEYIEMKNKKITLVALPDNNDPMLTRTRAIRVQDGLFMDRMQTHYSTFVQKIDPSYSAWQEHSLTESKALRKAQNKSVLQAIAAGLLLIGAVSAASDSNNYDTGAAMTSAIAAAGGIALLEQSFASNAEGKFHRDALVELGQSLNFEVAPQVIEIENTTVSLTGGISEQFRQWRSHLGQIYEKEKTPDKQL